MIKIFETLAQTIKIMEFFTCSISSPLASEEDDFEARIIPQEPGLVESSCSEQSEPSAQEKSRRHRVIHPQDIEASISTRDIVRCLTGLSDSNGARVNFEIIWIDDTTFLAGATKSIQRAWQNSASGAHGNLSQRREYPVNKGIEFSE